MEDCAVGHRARQVGAEAAIDGHHQLQCGQAASVVKTRAVFKCKGVAFAGDHEVVVAVQAQLDGAAQFVGGNGSPHGQMPGLRLLAAKTTAHAPALDRDRVVV